MPAMLTVTVHTDGASRGNPGPAAIAYRIDGLTQPIEFARVIDTTTNNQAEYQALIAALERLITEDIRSATVDCLADSELMVKQLKGEYRVKDRLLQPRFLHAQQLIRQLEATGNLVSFTAIRREKNQRADELANQALDSKQQ